MRPSSAIAAMLSGDAIRPEPGRPEGEAGDEIGEQDRLPELLRDQPEQPGGGDAESNIANEFVHEAVRKAMLREQTAASRRADRESQPHNQELLKMEVPATRTLAPLSIETRRGRGVDPAIDFYFVVHP